MFDVMDYGAVGDGITDDTAAINTAIAAANTAGVGSILYFPAASYKITAALNTVSCSIHGDGPGSTYILPPVTAGVFNVSTSGGAVAVEGLSINYPSAANSGTTALMLQSTAPGGIGWGPIIRDVYIGSAYVGVNFKNQAIGAIDNLHVTDIRSVGLLVNNPLVPDGGDTAISNCQFWGSNMAAPVGTAILWQSSGGFKVCNSKFNVLSVGFNLNLASGANTSQISIHDNCFDTCGGYGVVATRAGATGTLYHFSVNNNIFSACASGLTIGQDPSLAWLTNVSLSGNVWSNFAPGNIFVALASCHNVVVANNALYSYGGAIAYEIAPSVSTGIVGPNSKFGAFAASMNYGAGISTINPT